VLAADDERGMASAAFYGGGGQLRALLGVEADGSPMLQLLDPAGRRRVWLAAPRSESLLVLGDEQERHVTLGALRGTPMLSLNEEGRSRAQMQLSERGVPSVALFTAAGERGATVLVGTDGAPVLTMFEDGRPRATMGVVNATSVINLTDAARARLVIGVAENGRPSITFLDEAGRAVQELPEGR